MKSDSNLDNKKILQQKISSLDEMLKSIKDQYKSAPQISNNIQSPSLLQRIVSAQKDLSALKDKLQDAKKDIQQNTQSINSLNVSFQQLSGSVNQLKLIVDQFKEDHQKQKQNKLNLFWQLFIPICLAIIFFLFGLFFKSCSSIHEQNINKGHTPKTSQYFEFEQNNK